jgi:hypothetical protein
MRIYRSVPAIGRKDNRTNPAEKPSLGWTAPPATA